MEMFTFVFLSFFTLTIQVSANTGKSPFTEFTLVDSRGNLVVDQLGLLLYKGGTVCDDSFDMNAADAICKVMGYTDAVTWTIEENFDIQSNYKINLDDVQCTDPEWKSCSYTETYTNCGHSEDVFLSCNPTDTKRRIFDLVDSEGNFVEGENKLGLLLYNGGTVCDDNFDFNAADAICKVMGYTDAVEWIVGEYFDFQNHYRITLDDVQCRDSEWKSCSYTETDINCGHSEDVMLRCNPTGIKRPLFTLVDSEGNYIEKEDRLGLLLYNGGTVCDDGFDFTAANAICKHMGYTDATGWTVSTRFVIQDDYEIRLDDVSCSSTNWTECTYSMENNCGHSEDVFLSCNPSDTKTPLFALVDSEGKHIKGPQLGLLLYQGGTVCDDNFDFTAATAICKYLGFTDAIRWTIHEDFDIQSIYMIRLDDVECNFEDWDRCSYTDVHENINCAHTEDVFLSCNPTDEDTQAFTLVDSKGNEVEGEELGLLLYHYGTVCDDSFDTMAANAICKNMGYAGAITWNSQQAFDIQNDFEINLDDVVCTNSEWEDCNFSEDHNCGHSEDVFLSCEAKEEEEPPTPDEGTLGWVTAEHNVPRRYSSDCDLKVRTAGRYESQGKHPPKSNWNGDITFFAGDQELLYIGLHPFRQGIAVRNEVFGRGILMPIMDHHWVEAAYPDADEEGIREYTFYFTASGFGLRCGHDTMLIFILYDELTRTKEFANRISSVQFGLKYSPASGPILLQYAIECPEF